MENEIKFLETDIYFKLLRIHHIYSCLTTIYMGFKSEQYSFIFLSTSQVTLDRNTTGTRVFALCERKFVATSLFLASNIDFRAPYYYRKIFRWTEELYLDYKTHLRINQILVMCRIIYFFYRLIQLLIRKSYLKH